jgi:tripartite-type tricarboxylate transporter receptor subunit TctC
MAIARRAFVQLATAVAALPALGGAARAQAWPSKTVRIVVTFPAGGANDIIARLVAQRLTERLGQPFIVDNRVGSGGNTGAAEALRAPPDGYTLLQATVANSTNAALYDNLSFNFVNDTAPISGLYVVPLVMVTHPSFPAKTIPEFIAYAKANPGKINYGTGGVGSVSHIAGELFKIMAGVDMVHLPYRGSPPALADLLAARYEVLFDPLPTSIEHIRSGALRGLAMTTPQRSFALPDVPTVSEFLPGFEASPWIGLTAPRATPPEITARLNKEVVAILDEPAFKSRLNSMGAATLPMTQADFGALIARDTEKWAKVIKAANIKPE